MSKSSNQRESLVSTVSTVTITRGEGIIKWYKNATNKFYQEAVLYSTVEENVWNSRRYHLAAYGEKGSFLLATYKNADTALFAFETIIKTGDTPRCACGDTDFFKLVEGLDGQKFPYCYACYGDVKGFSFKRFVEA